MNTRYPLFCFTCALLLALGGCEKVEFQSPPSLPLASCDQAFVGSWLVEDVENGDDDDSPMYLRVTEGCADWWGIELDQANPGNAKVEDLTAKMRLGFAHTEDRRYIAARDEPGEAPVDADAQPEGSVLVEYRVVESGLEMRMLDPRKTANAIIDGDLEGWVEKRDRAADGRIAPLERRFYVYVFGSADETRDALEQHAANLLGPVWLRLTKVDPATAEQIALWTAAGPTPAPSN